VVSGSKINYYLYVLVLAIKFKISLFFVKNSPLLCAMCVILCAMVRRFHPEGTYNYVEQLSVVCFFNQNEKIRV
jgi:hypothetical protein